MQDKIKNRYIVLVLVVTALLCSCTTSKKPEVTPQELAAFNLKLKQADEAYANSSYTSLKQAWRLYQELQAFPAYQRKSSERFVRTSLLLSLRERELAVFNPTTLKEASQTVALNPALADYADVLESVIGLPLKTKGITGEKYSDNKSLDDYMKWSKERVPILFEILKEKAVSEDLLAYIYITFNSNFAYKLKDEDNLLRFQELFPTSPLLAFKYAIYPLPSQEKLEDIVQHNPDFHEAHIFLGDLQLQQGFVLSAEKEYLQAHEHIPDSTSLAISLSKVYFHMEEFEICLDYNQQALDLAPQYRDALLGKAMCLGYLGRHEEAITELQRMLELGYYYIGETYYWLAWNQKELERYDEAGSNIESAKSYLFGHHEVMFLSGIIAYHQERLQDAETYLKEALNLPPGSCETSFYLGKVYADTQKWEKSGEYFEQAAGCDQQTEIALEAKIQEIESAALSAARKAKLIRNKQAQLLQTRNTKATAWYNSAAGYYNAQKLDKALALAQLASTHPAFREKAEDLILAIKQKK